MKILISIDTSKVAHIVLEEAQVFLNNMQDAEVYVFTVIDIGLIALGHDTDEVLMMDTLQQEADELKSTISRILGDRKFTFTSEIGYPVDAILEKIETLQCDLHIIGTHGRTGFDHLLIGSVAEKVLRHSTCNTLIIPIKKKVEE